MHLHLILCQALGWEKDLPRIFRGGLALLSKNLGGAQAPAIPPCSRGSYGHSSYPTLNDRRNLMIACNIFHFSPRSPIKQGDPKYDQT